ncbi:hypothetical protein [Sandaracinus amylolyticus]|uniref:Uncharacterized protein n=1 Tax=Sandaracinus amylolyticus TaxID=927083 RepID=A0A0F6W514_9BACT|nr:hypothetical protein [Sandaracinus amylolyticus]AKF07662.1 hypothetical protein DB32_004811 [Sandaracinus amylolyticus]
MRRATAGLALFVLAACGGASSTTSTSTTPSGSSSLAPVATGPIVPSEGALNGPPPSAGATAPDVSATSTPTPAAEGEILTIAPGFRPDPIIRRGQAGGPLPAESISPDCRGYVSSAPSFLLKVDAPVPSLRVLVHMQGDATLVVQLAEGRVLCNDDTEGLDPIVEGAFPAGRHRVFVGTYGEDAAGTPYTLAVTTQSSLSTVAIESLPETR